MAVEFCKKCKSILIYGGCSNKNCVAREYGIQDTQANPSRKGWIITDPDTGATSFLDFKEPVTYEQAIESYNKLKKICQEEFEDDKPNEGRKTE